MKRRTGPPLPKLPKRDLTEDERWRRFVWEDGDIEVEEATPSADAEGHGQA